jgi:hypothetical protein
MSEFAGKYKFYNYIDKEGRRVIVAATHDAGQVVRAIATCSLDDTFDAIKGAELAAARCNLKVLKRREKRALERFEKTLDDYIKATSAHEDAYKFYSKALSEVATAENYIETITKEL